MTSRVRMDTSDDCAADTAVAAIEVVPYDASWPAQFEDEKALLEPLLLSWLVAPIEHIGSTAVPGLRAKPVIDIMAPVRNLQESRSAIDAVIGAGYVYFPYKTHLMHWFCKPCAAHRTHHLHLVPLRSPHWQQRLGFRDALLRSQQLAAEYAELKSLLAARYRFDREAYTQAKTPFVERVLAKRAIPHR